MNKNSSRDSGFGNMWRGFLKKNVFYINIKEYELIGLFTNKYKKTKNISRHRSMTCRMTGNV